MNKEDLDEISLLIQYLSKCKDVKINCLEPFERAYIAGYTRWGRPIDGVSYIHMERTLVLSDDFRNRLVEIIELGIAQLMQEANNE